MRQANVFIKQHFAGRIVEDDRGYTFTYDQAYLNANYAEALSLTMPLKDTEYHSMVLFPFFDGLIPEGWLLDIAENSWKINRQDRFSLLLACCKDCIGHVSVVPSNDE